MNCIDELELEALCATGDPDFAAEIGRTTVELIRELCTRVGSAAGVDCDMLTFDVFVLLGVQG